jgi:hypothetical protein
MWTMYSMPDINATLNARVAERSGMSDPLLWSRQLDPVRPAEPFAGLPDQSPVPLADAIGRAGRADRNAVIEALAATGPDFTSHIMPYGPTRFVNGQNQTAAPVNTQVQGGDIKVIFPNDFADARPIFPVTG